MTTDPHWLREQLLVALAADDELFELLTLKGGNALALVHKIGHRTSLDLDYSLRDDVAREVLEPRIFAALRRRLTARGLHLFDELFTLRPPSPAEPRWGGYRVEFKVIDSTAAQQLGIEAARRQAVRVEPNQQASVKWCIEISRQEAIPEHEELRIADGFTCRVYTKTLIAVEKLRALLPPVFAAKDVPIGLLRHIPSQAGFHAEDWDRVRNSIPADRPREFSFYEQFVRAELLRLYSVLGW